MTPAAPPGDPDPGGDKVLPDNIVRYAHMFLALGEGIAPYEVTPELVTVGRYDFGGALPLGMCAHPKIDPGDRRDDRVPLRSGGALPLLGGDRGRAHYF
jgi:hypothetical protein